MSRHGHWIDRIRWRLDDAGITWEEVRAAFWLALGLAALVLLAADGLYR